MSSSKSNRCVFFEVFKNFINTFDEANYSPEQQQSPQYQMMLQQNFFEQRQAISLPISPFIIHQILRNEGFATRILIFGNNQNNQNNSNNTQQFQNEDGSITAVTDSYVRCLVQFETEQEAQKVVSRYGASMMTNSRQQQGSVVFLQGIPSLMLRLRAKPSRDGQVFVTGNTETSLVVTPEYFHFLGPDFPRTSNQVHEQRMQATEINNQQQQQQQVQFQAFEREKKIEPQVQQVVAQQQQEEQEEEEVVVPRKRTKYQAPVVRQREE